MDEALRALQSPDWSVRAAALRSITAKLSAAKMSEDDERALVRSVIAAAADVKWEVQKAAAIALSEFRFAEPTLIRTTLEALGRAQHSHYVNDAAERALKRIRTRTERQNAWQLAGDTRDPTLQHIMARIREIGLRSMTPARIYELAMEISEQSYRELAADTAHELRNFLAPFEGYLLDAKQELEEEPPDTTEAMDLIGCAASRLKQVTRLIDDLGTYSTATRRDFAPIELAPLIREAVAVGADRGEQASPNDAKVKQVIEVQVGIIIDALDDRLGRAITNLVANAYQAMEAGGTLTVSAEVVSGDRLILVIGDTGKGMTAEEIEHARMRFRSTRRSQGGTGLGLPIAERIIVEDHGGEFDIDSTPGEGTRVRLTLPLRQAVEGD